jgi:uncharacterized protein (DUF433 family)
MVQRLNSSATADIFPIGGFVTTLRRAVLTVPEAAYVAGVSPRMVQHEIDEQIVESRDRGGRRSMSGADVLYLTAVRRLHAQLAPKLRRQLRDAIATSVARNRDTAKIETFVVSLTDLECGVLPEFETLERVKRDLIQTHANVLAGEPVIAGTRISARLVADLTRKGAKSEELQDEFDLSPEQVEAAIVFDQVNPKRGRPRAPRRSV